MEFRVIRSSAGIVLVIGAALALAVWYRHMRHRTESIGTQDLVGRHGVVGVIGTSADSKSAADLNSTIGASSVHVVPPPELSAWYQWNAQQRLALVSELQHDTHLSPVVTDFMKKVIYDRTLSAVLRNNMANALNNQAVVDVDLANMFAAMAENADEDMVWREYAAQHLGTAIATSKDPSVGAAVLWQLADKGEGPIPGTALLHLHYLDRRHTVSAPDDFAKRLASVAVDPQAHLLTRMSALGIIGQRKLVELAPVVREIAQSDVPALQRSALATLGIIGIRADLEVILRHANDQDPTVSRAARAAAQRLTASIKAQENSNVPSRL